MRSKVGSGLRCAFAVALALLAFACSAQTHTSATGQVPHDASANPRAPKETSLPAVTGQATIGQTLTVSHGGWNHVPTSYSYHWEDCANETYCIGIAGATSKSYAVRANDFDYHIRGTVTACNASGCSSTSSAPTLQVTGTQPSGVGLPPKLQTDSFGTTWREVGEDDFTIDAPLGSWATTDHNAVVYTGDRGLRWTEYPDGWPCQAASHCYRPADVLSVHDGVLDYWLHDCRYPDGVFNACGADPSPLVTRGLTYGRYEARFKVVWDDAGYLDQYHMAWLLWPQARLGCNQAAESDFPELELDAHQALVFAHYSCRGYDFFERKVDLLRWNTFTQEWGPGFRRYYMNGRLVGVSTTNVYRGRERWQLQIEAPPTIGNRTSGHVLVDWVWVGALDRGSR